MLRNASYNNKEIFNEINKLVGKPFGLKKRIQMGGTGSQRFVVKDSSHEITRLFDLDNNINYCNIELRNHGIIIRFRSLLETYAWAISFDRLSLNQYTDTCFITDEEHYMHIEPAYNTSFNQEFFKKLHDMNSNHNIPT